MEGIGLVLEGGGMRGVYTAGILDYFMEQNLYFPYVIGVSAGACHAASYVSRQIGRNRRVNIDYIRDPRYLSKRNFIKTKSIFGMDFVFNQIPNRLDPFDYETFYESKQKYLIGTTDCKTGEPVYFEKDQCDKDLILKVLMASSSLPYVAPVVEIKGQFLLDGGISDPIPVKKSIQDGNERQVIILTRNKGYLKKPVKQKWLVKRTYSKYPGLVQAMLQRHEVYNKTLELIEQLEQEDRAFVIRPSSPIQVKRLEKDPNKLMDLYRLGYEDGRSVYRQLMSWANIPMLS